MKTRLFSVCLLTSALLVTPKASFAQPGLKDAPSDKSDKEDHVAAGRMTEAAKQGKRLFDAERWSEAALVLKGVVNGEAGDDEGNRQIAQYHLAIALYRLQLYQASYSIFAEVAEKPTHIKFNETLLWLARLATQLPEPADVIERLGKYKGDQIARFDNPEQQSLYWQLNYLLGRYKYRNRSYEDALTLFGKIDRKSKFYVEGQFFSGIAYVQLRKLVPAVKAFQRIVQVIDEGGEGAPREARMRDLANLSMGRAYYSASVHLGEPQAPTLDQAKLSAAVKYWDRIDTASEYWQDGLFEESWAYFMAGDYPHALGNLHTIEAPYFPNAFYPEADVLRAVITFTLCRYDDALTISARMTKKYEPIKKELEATLSRFKGEGSEEQFFQFLKDVRGGKTNLSPTLRPVVEGALSDRQILRHLDYVRVLDEEEARFKRAPASFRSSPLGADVADALSLARDIAVRNAGALTRERSLRTLDELNEHLRDASKIFVGITAERARLDKQVLKGDRADEQTRGASLVKPDDGYVAWPFDGEYWKDELGLYRQAVTSKCGK